MSKRKKILFYIAFIILIIFSVLMFIYECFNKKIDFMIIFFTSIILNIISLIRLYKAK